MTDIESLQEELKRENKSRNEMSEELKNMEKTIKEIKSEIIHLRKQDPMNGGTDSEGYKRLQEQHQSNAKLEKSLALERERLRILTERNSDITDMDLDLLSQTELIRFVKQLERTKTDLQSALREIEASLDLQAKEYKRLNEMKNMFKTEISLRQKKKQI